MRVYDENMMFPSQKSSFLQEKVVAFAKHIEKVDLYFLRVHVLLFFHAKIQTSLKIGWGTFTPSTNVFNKGEVLEKNFFVFLKKVAKWLEMINLKKLCGRRHNPTLFD